MKPFKKLIRVFLIVTWSACTISLLIDYNWQIGQAILASAMIAGWLFFCYMMAVE